jgi:hypothetical protein
MIDTRIASNLLIFLRPQIEQATWLLEAVRELEAVVTSAPDPSVPVVTKKPPVAEPSAPADAPTNAAEQVPSEPTDAAA